jgi:hypothetical protein
MSGGVRCIRQQGLRIRATDREGWRTQSAKQHYKRAVFRREWQVSSESLRAPSFIRQKKPTRFRPDEVTSTCTRSRPRTNLQAGLRQGGLEKYASLFQPYASPKEWWSIDCSQRAGEQAPIRELQPPENSHLRLCDSQLFGPPATDVGPWRSQPSFPRGPGPPPIDKSHRCARHLSLKFAVRSRRSAVRWQFGN